MSTMDDHETAWADINPPMASAPRPAPLSAFSTSRLEPATRTEFRNELTACLALVAPVGMDEAARGEWLAVAWDTLKHLPSDLLSIGCRKAREVADHPSKIVPAILAETDETLRRRRELAREYGQPVPRLEAPKEDICTPEQARAILEEFGLAGKFESNRPVAHPTGGA